MATCRYMDAEWRYLTLVVHTIIISDGVIYVESDVRNVRATFGSYTV